MKVELTIGVKLKNTNYVYATGSSKKNAEQKSAQKLLKNGEHVWISGHWENKKIGYVFINGICTKKGKGWVWTEGYWKKIDLNKWMNLYA